MNELLLISIILLYVIKSSKCDFLQFELVYADITLHDYLFSGRDHVVEE